MALCFFLLSRIGTEPVNDTKLASPSVIEQEWEIV